MIQNMCVVFRVARYSAPPFSCVCFTFTFWEMEFYARRLHKHIIMRWKWISIRLLLLLPVDSIYILFKILIMKIKLNIVSSHYLNNMQ